MFEETRVNRREQTQSNERLPLTKEALSRFQLKNSGDFAIVHINHLLGDVVEFNRLLEQHFTDVHFIPLDYAKIDRVEMSKLRPIYADLAATRREYIVIEDGGYWASMMSEVREDYAPLAHVEQTTKGARVAARAISSSKLTHSVYSIARSLPKVRIENFFIANRILLETELLLSKMGETCIFRSCMVIGYGIIGRAVAKALNAAGCDVYVHDADEAILNSAIREGFKSVSLLETTTLKKLYVFGASGNDVSANPLFGKIIDLCAEVFLISCSSGEIEYANWRKSHIQYRENLPKLGEIYRDTGSRVVILANGRPVNFFREDSESLPDCVADLVNATLITAATTAVQSTTTLPCLKLLDVNVFEKRGWDGLSLVERWASMHGFFEKGIASETGNEQSVHPLEARLANIQI